MVAEVKFPVLKLMTSVRSVCREDLRFRPGCELTLGGEFTQIHQS